MTRFLRWLLIGATLLAVALGAMAVYALQDPNRFKPRLESVIANQGGVPLEIHGELAWRLWPPLSLSAEDLSADYQGQDWQVGRLTLDLDAWQVLRDPQQWQVQSVSVTDVTLRERDSVLTVKHARLSDLAPNRPAPITAELSYAPTAAAEAVPLSLRGTVNVDPETLNLVLDRTRFETRDGAGVCSANARPIADPQPAPPATPEDVLPLEVLRSFSWRGDCLLDWVELHGHRFEQVEARFHNDAGRGVVEVGAPRFFGGEALLRIAIDAAGTPVRWVVTPELTDVDSTELLAWLDQRLDWAAPLAYGGTLTFEGNTPQTMLASLSGETRFDGGRGHIDISRIREPLIALAGRFNEAERIRGWPQTWQYQKLVGHWRIDRQHHVLDAALDNLRLEAEGDYRPASGELDLLIELVFGNDPALPVFDVNPLLYDMPIPVRCRGALENPTCRVDQDAARQIVARALTGEDTELRSTLERKIDEQVPEQYRDAARSLLEALGGSLKEGRAQGSPDSRQEP